MPSPTGIVDKNQANKSVGHHIHNYSTFDRSLSYRFYNCHRFGDYTPSFVMDGVPNDEISLNSYDGIDSLSLKAPFKGSIRKIKESFMVPNMAILPINWDRIYTQPSNGDDVPTGTNCVLENFPSNMQTLWSGCFSAVTGLPLTTDAQLKTFLTGLLRLCVLGEFVYSTGSLLNNLGYKANTQLTFFSNDPQANLLSSINYDQWFDQVIYSVFEDISSITVYEPVGGSTVTHRFNGLSGYSSDNSVFQGYQSFRSMLELFRENPLCYVYDISVAASSSTTAIRTSISSMISTSYGLLNSSTPSWHLPNSSYTGDTSDITSLNPNLLNLTRILSYQLVCAHFYSNSSIDFIYSAELYRQYINVLYRIAVQSSYSTVYTWNGMSMNYDYLSGTLLNRLLGLNNTNTRSALLTNFSSNTHASALHPLAAWASIFGFRKSLRYGDYFTASRPRPLAPINTDVSVNSNLVSVVDITRNIQAQRFANAVMRSRSKIEEYVKSLFGKAPQPDYHNPFFLSRTEEIIFGDQVQNTAQNTSISMPQSRTANFAGNLSRHTFTFHNDDMHPCTYLQIVSYDSPRAYSRSVDRSFLHLDRFDMFNPDFQYIGDQPVYGIELGYWSGSTIPNIFSYQTRDMEYKQRFDVCSTGFASGSLPGWSFNDERLNSIGFTSISPDFIRSRNTDIDYLYLSLTGFSLGTYFHFTCVTDNNVKAKRAMAVDPQILA